MKTIAASSIVAAEIMKREHVVYKGRNDEAAALHNTESWEGIFTRLVESWSIADFS